jgi:hypothetical protein
MQFRQVSENCIGTSGRDLVAGERQRVSVREQRSEISSSRKKAPVSFLRKYIPGSCRFAYLSRRRDVVVRPEPVRRLVAAMPRYESRLDKGYSLTRIRF